MEAPDPSDPVAQPDQSERDEQDPTPPAAPMGVDITTIGLLVFFIALIGIVAALLLLPILAG
ncbi:MAG: hypothetical protein WEE67_07755 [Chloroflexota bacterium]